MQIVNVEHDGPADRLGLASYLCPTRLRIDSVHRNTVLQREDGTVQTGCHYRIHAGQQRLELCVRSQTGSVDVQSGVDRDDCDLIGRDQALHRRIGCFYMGGWVLLNQADTDDRHERMFREKGQVGVARTTAVSLEEKLKRIPCPEVAPAL